MKQPIPTHIIELYSMSNYSIGEFGEPIYSFSLDGFNFLIKPEPRRLFRIRATNAEEKKWFQFNLPLELLADKGFFLKFFKQEYEAYFSNLDI